MMNEHESRLRMMIDPAQQTWDLSPNDVAAFAVSEFGEWRKIRNKETT